MAKPDSENHRPNLLNTRKSISLVMTAGLLIVGCRSESSPYGQYISLGESPNEVELVSRPLVEKVKFIPGIDGKIPVRDDPDSKANLTSLPLSQIKSNNAAWVFGRSYPGDKWGDIGLTIDGQPFRGGAYAEVSSNVGRPRSLGQPPVTYATHQYVEVEKEPVPVTDLALLNPEGFYEGTVLVKGKEPLGIRTSAEVPVGRDNSIPWGEIVSIQGIDISGKDEFGIRNPLIVKGVNPTEDKGRFPSVWLVVWIERQIKGSSKTESVKAYINMSKSTIGLIDPDSLDWPDKIVLLEKGKILPQRKFNVVDLHPVIKVGNVVVETEDGGSIKVLPVPETTTRDMYSGWKTFPGKGFTLRYPSQPEWESNGTGIFLLNPNRKRVGSITAWVEPLKDTLDAYVQQQMEALIPRGLTEDELKQAWLKIISSPGKVGKWSAEVLNYQTEAGDDFRRFMVLKDGNIYNIVVSEPWSWSEIAKYDPVNKEIVNSLAYLK